MHPGHPQAPASCVCRTQPFHQLINTSKRGICCCVELALSSTSAHRQCSCSGVNVLSGIKRSECSRWLTKGNFSIWKTEQRECCSFQSPLTPGIQPLQDCTAACTRTGSWDKLAVGSKGLVWNGDCRISVVEIRARDRNPVFQKC